MLRVRIILAKNMLLKINPEKNACSKRSNKLLPFLLCSCSRRLVYQVLAGTANFSLLFSMLSLSECMSRAFLISLSVLKLSEDVHCDLAIEAPFLHTTVR